MKQFKITLDLVSDWQQYAYCWFVSNCGRKWKFVNKKNEHLIDAVSKNEFSAVSESDRNALLAYYYNLFHRIVSSRKRKLRTPDASALFASVPDDKFGELHAGWSAFVKDVTDGRNLEQRQTEKRFEIDGKDVLLDRFRIHHFHLAVKPRKRGDFIAYCFVNADVVKVIAIETHRGFGIVEVCQSIVEKAYALYPEEFSSFRIEDNHLTPTDSLEEQKKLAWLNINVCFFIGMARFYPIGMGTMMNGISLEAQRWMMWDLRLLRAASSAMGTFANESYDIIGRLIPGSISTLRFNLFDFNGSTVEARTSDESLRMTYDILTNRVVLSCVGHLARKL